MRDDFDPDRAEGIGPDQQSIIAQAQCVALYLNTLKRCGIPDAEALELTQTWVSEQFALNTTGEE